MVQRSVTTELFAKHGRLLDSWQSLNADECSDLINQFKGFDITELETKFVESGKIKELKVYDPIDKDHYALAKDFDENSMKIMWKDGMWAIASSKVAAVCLAGGQATRLGVTEPKGTIPLNLGDDESTDSLLGLQAARIARLQTLASRECGAPSPTIWWIIMVSSQTLAMTRKHLVKIIPENGLSMDQVRIIVQGNAPCFDTEGRLFLSEQSKIATSPNGNGGFYEAVAPHLNDLESLGVQYFHVYCVDNVLCRVADPYFLGFCIQKGADCAAKAVEKVEPEEKVGIICKGPDGVEVVEYSEIPMELSAKRDESDRLVLRAGNIANYFFSIEFVRRMASSVKLPYHRAFKKVPYWDQESRQVVSPTEENAYKVEKFIFDAFKFAKNFYVWEVIRGEEFSPLKNSDSIGICCMSTCRHDYYAHCRRILERAGITIDGSEKVYIHPSVTYAGEDLGIFEGMKFETPLIIGRNYLHEK